MRIYKRSWGDWRASARNFLRSRLIVECPSDAMRELSRRMVAVSIWVPFCAARVARLISHQETKSLTSSMVVNHLDKFETKVAVTYLDTVAVLLFIKAQSLAKQTSGFWIVHRIEDLYCHCKIFNEMMSATPAGCIKKSDGNSTE